MQGLEFDSQNLKWEGDWDRERAGKREGEREYGYKLLRMRETSMKLRCRMKPSTGEKVLNIEMQNVTLFMNVWKLEMPYVAVEVFLESKRKCLL